jgi:hypothetical protein
MSMIKRLEDEYLRTLDNNVLKRLNRERVRNGMPAVVHARTDCINTIPEERQVEVKWVPASPGKLLQYYFTLLSSETEVRFNPPLDSDMPSFKQGSHGIAWIITRVDAESGEERHTVKWRLYWSAQDASA